ncbi:MAG: T9SS type A sorting domain-containing protein [Bacteroidia bacterium]
MIFFIEGASSQNIFSGEPIQVVGAMNSYSTNAAANSTYRRVSINTGNPTDGRGQWVKTYFAASSSGQVNNSNMLGGSGNGFLFISGPSTNRFQNKWVFSAVSQAKLDTVNTCNAYNSGNDMGLNMSNPGYYTFVFNDCGYSNSNARFYAAYTNNTPISINSQTLSLGANNTSTIVIQTSASPSNGEFVYLRYTNGTSFSSTGTSTIVQANSTNAPTNTSWLANIPAQNNGAILRYYVFTSTVSLNKLNNMSEMDKSLSCLSVLDNSGNNYSYTFTPKYSIGFRVDMGSQICNGFDSITVIGNNNAFANWSTAYKLSNIPSSNIYGISLIIDSSSTLQYKYRLHKNGAITWESNFSTSSGNRELNLNKDTILGNACFNSLTASCPAAPAPSTISFLTDLSKTTPDPQGRVYVMGSFTNPTWSAGALRMFPVNGMPGYYQRIVTNVCPTTFEFKFVNGDSSLANTPESFPNPLQRSCTVSNGVGGFNRTYTRTSSNPVNLYFVFDSCTTALPVELIHFTAQVENEQIILYWQTAWEQNNKGFWVEASENGSEFETIGFVEGKGNSNQLNSYSFLTRNNYNFDFFRLKQEDSDGGVQYSNIISAKNKDSEMFLSNIENPIKNNINLNFKQSGKFHVLIADLMGHVIYENNLTTQESNHYLIQLESLKQGVYLLNISNETETYTQKLIKE